MHRSLRKFLFLIVIVICLSFWGAGYFLIVNEPPQKSDIIIVLAGDKGHRLDYAVGLYHKGYSSQLLISGGPVYLNTTMAELMAKHAMELGVPKDAIILEKESNSTYQNALFSKSILQERQLNSALVVSSSYHMRRVRYTFNKVFQDTTMNLIYCAADEPQYNPGHWWSNNRSTLQTVTEYMKLLGYMMGRQV